MYSIHVNNAFHNVYHNIQKKLIVTALGSLGTVYNPLVWFQYDAFV